MGGKLMSHDLRTEPLFYGIPANAYLFWPRIGIEVYKAAVRTHADFYLKGWSSFSTLAKTGSREDLIRRKWNIPPRVVRH